MKESVYIAQNVYQNNFLSCQVLFHNVCNARNSQQTHTHNFEVLFVDIQQGKTKQQHGFCHVWIAYRRGGRIALL